MPDPTASTSAILGAILAGGRSQRMAGADKRYLKLGDGTLLSHAVNRALPQVQQLLLCTHADNPEFTELQLPVVHDLNNEHLGPAAGIISAFAWALQSRNNWHWLATFACDTPFYPSDLVSKLQQAATQQQAQVAIPCADGRPQYAFALWSFDVLPTLQQAVAQGTLALKHLLKDTHHCFVEWPPGTDAFFNINTQADWQKLQSANSPKS